MRKQETVFCFNYQHLCNLTEQVHETTSTTTISLHVAAVCKLFVTLFRCVFRYGCTIMRRACQITYFAAYTVLKSLITLRSKIQLY